MGVTPQGRSWGHWLLAMRVGPGCGPVILGQKALSHTARPLTGGVQTTPSNTRVQPVQPVPPANNPKQRKLLSRLQVPTFPSSLAFPQPPATEAQAVPLSCGVGLPARTLAWQLHSHGSAGTYACARATETLHPAPDRCSPVPWGRRRRVMGAQSPAGTSRAPGKWGTRGSLLPSHCSWTCVSTPGHLYVHFLPPQPQGFGEGLGLQNAKFCTEVFIFNFKL